ncbi:MAG: hypothetical protein ACK4ZE_13665, partial [Sphingorhabdus sp.]
CCGGNCEYPSVHMILAAATAWSSKAGTVFTFSLSRVAEVLCQEIWHLYRRYKVALRENTGA